MRYRDAFADLPVTMNPYDPTDEPNFWLSCLLIDREAMCREDRTDTTTTYVKEKGKTCPAEILGVLAAHYAEGRPIWKPMHRQPVFEKCALVTASDEGAPVSADIFARGLCLPSDIKMTEQEQRAVIALVKHCF